MAYRQSSIHNSNAMGAAFLARLGQLTGNRAMLAAAQDAMLYTCSRQRTDGAWFYGEEPEVPLGGQFPHGLQPLGIEDV